MRERCARRQCSRTRNRPINASLCGFRELAKQRPVAPLSHVGSQGMTEVERPQLSPYQVELETGKRYSWCRCGRSQKQPFCDGSHTGTGIEPLMLTAERTASEILFG